MSTVLVKVRRKVFESRVKFFEPASGQRGKASGDLLSCGRWNSTKASLLQGQWRSKGGFRNPGNGNGMCFNQSDRRPGADLPKNESGTVGAILCSNSRSTPVSAGNNLCIAFKAFASENQKSRGV